MSSADVFLKKDALNLLQGKSILMFGDSNMRAMYKDLLWLLEDGKLLPVRCLKLKNEKCHANDVNISNGKLTSSRNYVEVRRYTKTCFVQFEFITKLFSDNFVKTIDNMVTPIDFIVLNSCVWDLTRWGPNGVAEFKDNLKKSFEFLKFKLPNTRIIWTTALPPSFKARGGFLTEELNFLRDLLPIQVVEANNFSVRVAKELNVDVVDLHFYLRNFIDVRSHDGIHWMPVGLRYVTNLLLTQISTVTFNKLPGRVPVFCGYDIRLHDDMVIRNTQIKKNKNRKRKRKSFNVNNRTDNNNTQGFNFNMQALNFQFVNTANSVIFSKPNSNSCVTPVKVTIDNSLYKQFENFVQKLSC